jgi:hypothetical protein
MAFLITGLIRKGRRVFKHSTTCTLEEIKKNISDHDSYSVKTPQGFLKARRDQIIFINTDEAKNSTLF